MNAKLKVKQPASNPDTHLPEASDFRSNDVIHVTLDGQLRPVYAQNAPKKDPPKSRKWFANYLPFWDEGFWMASDRNRKSDEAEYSI